MTKKRVVVAMSGGVDSSVAAALLKEQGFEVVGITMCFGAPNQQASSTKHPLCCSPESIEDARRVAGILGIRHYVLNFARDLEKFVVDDFVREYLSGRTPNPCVRCNQFLKFGTLLKKAKGLDAQFLATGHYARIEFDKRLKCHLLKKGKDKLKDQSYFLSAVRRRILPFMLLPLGKYIKLEVRSFAKKFNLPVHMKPASQEICFIPNADYRGFIKNRLASLDKLASVPSVFISSTSARGGILRRGTLSEGEGQINKGITPGPILDTQGKVLGTHKGIAFYTIGQRQGLGVSFKEPLYVVNINPKNNSISLGTKGQTFFKGLIADNLNFLYPVGDSRKLDLKVKIRYNQQDVRAEIIFSPGFARVIFNKPQSSVAPGQAVVFYKGDCLVGSGTIIQGIQ